MTNASEKAILLRLRRSLKSLSDLVENSVLAKAIVLGLVGTLVFLGIKYALNEAEREKQEKQIQSVKAYELEQERRNQELENISEQVAPFDIGQEEFGSLRLGAFKLRTGLEPIITDQEDNSISANFGNGLLILTLYGSTRTINDDSFPIKVFVNKHFKGTVLGVRPNDTLETAFRVVSRDCQKRAFNKDRTGLSCVWGSIWIFSMHDDGISLTDNRYEYEFRKRGAR